MEISRTENGLLLDEIEPFIAELLRHIPVAADPSDSTAAEARLFSTITGGADEGLDAEWRELVKPELEQLFQSANDTVRADLQRMSERDAGGLREWSLRIPAEHFERWVNSLNQARLTLAARHDFGEAELNADERIPELESARGVALFQMHFYAFLQEIFLREMD